MPRYRVLVIGDDLDEANRRLVAAGIPTAGSGPASWDSEAPSPVSRLSAFVFAESADAARIDVKAHLPDGARVEVSEAIS